MGSIRRGLTSVDRVMIDLRLAVSREAIYTAIYALPRGEWRRELMTARLFRAV